MDIDFMPTGTLLRALGVWLETKGFHHGFQVGFSMGNTEHVSVVYVVCVEGSM